MTDTEMKNTLRSLAMLLDNCLPMMAKEATAERRREDGKTMRQCTKQRLHDRAKTMIARAFEMLGETRLE